MSDNRKYVQAQPFTFAGSGVNPGETSAVFSSFAGIDGDLLTMTDFGTKGFMTAEPGSGTLEEAYCFTGIVQNADGSATLSGISNVGFISPYTETSGFLKSHSGGTIAVITNTAGFYNDFANKSDDETIAGLWQFPNNGNTPVLGASYVAPTLDTQVVSKKYVDDVAVSGAPDANTTTKGIVQIATGAQLAAGTGTGSTGAVIVSAGSSFKNTSAGAGDVNKVPVLNSSGVLDQTFLGGARTWTAVQSFTADNAQITTTPDSGNDATNKTYVDLQYVNEFGDGSDGDVTIAAPTTLARNMFYNSLTMTGANDITTAGYRVYVKNTLTRSAASTGKFKNNGSVGGNGVTPGSDLSAAGGAAGTIAAAVTLPSTGAAGAGGTGRGVATAGTFIAGDAGAAGGSTTNSINTTSTVTAGAGGNSTGGGAGTGGAAGAAGATTQTVAMPRDLTAAQTLSFVSGSSTIVLRGPASGPGGGGGSGSTDQNLYGSGGGGGGAGSSGGPIFVAAKTVVDSGSGTMFQSIGGNGGNGGGGFADPGGGAGNRSGGGGGAGPGGNGGTILRIYKSLTGTATTDVVGGSAGTAGTGASFGTGVGANGGTATAGNVGLVLDIIV